MLLRKEDDTVNIIDLINKAYDKRAQSDTGHRCPLRISSLGKCPRAMAHLLRQSVTTTPDARSQRIFELGTQRGEALARAVSEVVGHPTEVTREREVWLPLRGVKNAGEVIARCAREFGATLQAFPEAKFPRYMLGIPGHVDFDIEVAPKRLHVFEVKTKNSYGFDKLGTEGAGYEYTTQLAGYVEALRSMGYDVLSATWIFENKDTSELKPIPFNLSLRIDDVCDTLSGVINDWMEGLPAERSVAAYAQGVQGRLPWNCNYCSVGPMVGACAPHGQLVDKRKAGSDKPAWTVQ